jgi:sugar-specific transcriptional regulator TrmB
MPEEKIGEDVLGGMPASRIPPKKRRELQEKLKKALEEKKRKEQEELEKLPTEGIPGETPHDATPEERAEIMEKFAEEMKKKKTVHVDEHLRSKPKKKKKSLADTLFEFL